MYRAFILAKPMTKPNNEIQLVRHPNGMPVPQDFAIVASSPRTPGKNDVLVRNLYMSVDPYMRGRMNLGDSYIPPFKLNHCMEGTAVGEVVESHSADFQPGDVVLSNYGWREYFTASSTELSRLCRDIQPLSIYLGVLGITGLTAWTGMNLVPVKAGEVVFVSGAAGAVGNIAGQLAKQLGCRVIGSTGSEEKASVLRKQGSFDVVLNYHAAPIDEQLKLEAPDGIDVYFDNVGGESLQAALSALRNHGRIIACGSISGYNEAHPQPGPSNLFQIISKRITMKGFIVMDWMHTRLQFEKEMGALIAQGKVVGLETVVSGIDHAIDAFIGLFHGKNLGKMVVKLA
jgi:NADPH-dependent curcumin reductase CurA